MHENLRTAFGVAVKRNRNNRGMTQEELAEATQLHRTYISDVERGTRNLSLAAMLKIAEGLVTQISALFAEAEAEAKNNNHHQAAD